VSSLEYLAAILGPSLEPVCGDGSITSTQAGPNPHGISFVAEFVRLFRARYSTALLGDNGVVKNRASNRGAAPEEVHDQRDHRNDQQQVNQAASNVECKKSQQPQYK